jgi:hypothetical protein
VQDSYVKVLVAKLQERSPKFLGHIDTPAAAILWGVKHVMDRIIGPLHMQKPVWVLGILPKLDIVPVQSEGLSLTHPGTGETKKIGIVLRIVLAHRRQVARQLGTRKGSDHLLRIEPLLWHIFP